MNKSRSFLFFVFAVLVAANLGAQSTDGARPLKGTVRSNDGAPVVGADVFLLETLEGATTDSAGSFVIRTSRAGPATIVARRIGFAPAQLSITVASADTLLLTLTR